MNSALVSSTSSSSICRHEIIFDCSADERGVHSTTGNDHQLSYVPSIATYHEAVNKIGLQSIISEAAHHLMQPMLPPSPHPTPHATHATHASHPSPHFINHNILEDHVNTSCEQPVSDLPQQFNLVKQEVAQQDHVISDLPVLSRARASLPAAYLYIQEIDLTESIFGVFAKKTIPKRTQFGPVEGVVVPHNHSNFHNPKHNLMIFITDTLILDQTDENQSNWMKFVRSANTYEEQNLALITKEQVYETNPQEIEIKFYFITTRPINAREELKVWYSKEYGEKFNVKVLEAKPLVMHENESQTLENSVVRRRTAQTVDITGHKLRNKIAKTQQQQQQLQRLETESSNINCQSDSTTVDAKENNSPKYQCDTCQKVFPRFYSLRRHQIMHSGEKKFKCPLCAMSFSHVYNRNRHVKRHAKVNNNNKKLVQTHITPAINSNDHFSNDVQTNKQIKLVDEQTAKQQQQQQQQQYDSNTTLFLKPHLTVARKSAPKSITTNKPNSNTCKPYRCHECYKSFTTDDRLLRHAIVHSSDEDVKPLACQFCQKRFLNNSALSCHLKVHSTPKDQPRRYDCVICKQWFESTQIRKDHIITHADPITGHYTCPNCSKPFEEFSAVRKHIRAFHSDKQYPCTQCEKVFPRPDKLKLHMLRHSDHREFLCANCGKQFKRKDKLKEHMQRMHAPDREAKLAAKQAAKQAQQQNQHHKKFIPKVSPTDYHRFIYKCHTCLLGFKRRGMLVNHLAKRHPDIPPDSVPELNLPILKTTRDYYCQYCDKIYKSSSKRKAHIMKNHPGKSLPLSNRHKGGVPVIPGVPNPTYSATVGSITTHPHYCDWCHKQYASKAKLLQHQRKKHPEQIAIINSHARSRQRSVSMTPASQSTNLMANPAQQNLSLSPGVSTSLITILGNLNNIITATMNSSDLSQSTASSADLQELLQGSSGDLLTQAMSELTATKSDASAATLIITAQSADDANWGQEMCHEINGVE